MDKPKTETQKFIELAKDCAEKTGLSLARIGTIGGDNGSFFKNLESGERTCTLSKVEGFKKTFARLISESNTT